MNAEPLNVKVIARVMDIQLFCVPNVNYSFESHLAIAGSESLQLEAMTADNCVIKWNADFTAE